MLGNSNVQPPLKRALVVQPDPGLRQQVSAELAHRGFQVDACASAAEGADAFQYQPLIVTVTGGDEQFPGGLFIDWLRKQCPEGAPTPYILAVGDVPPPRESPELPPAWDEQLPFPIDWTAFRARLEAIETWLLEHGGLSGSSFGDPAAPPSTETSLHEFQTVIDQTPRPMAVCDRDLRYLAVNLRWRKDFDLDRDDLIGQKHDSIFPYLGHHWDRALRSVFQGNTEDCARDLWVMAGNRPVWVRWHLQPWTSTSGTLGGLTITCDCLDQPDAPSGPNRMEQIGRSLVHGSANPFLHLDLDGRIQSCNQAAHRWTLSGSAPQDGDEFWNLFCPEDSREVLRLQFLNDAQKCRDQDRFCFAPVWTQVLPEDHPMGPEATWSAHPYLDAHGRLTGVLLVGTPLPKVPATQVVPPKIGSSLAQLVDFAPFGLILLDEEGHTVFANHEQASLLGLDLRSHAGIEEWLRTACPDPSRTDQLVEDWKSSVWGGETTRTFTLRSSDHLKRQIRFHPRRTSDGGMLLALSDVTEFHQTIDAVRTDEAQFRTLFQNANVGIVLESPVGQVIDVNPAAETLTRLSRDQILQRRFLDVIHAEDRSAVETRLAEVQSRPGLPAPSLDVRLAAPEATTDADPSDDSRIRLALSPVPDADGRPLFLAYFLTDVAIERFDQEALPAAAPADTALQESLRRHALVFAHSRDATVITDHHGRILDWNPAAGHLFGYRRDEVLGRNLASLFAPDEPARFHHAVADAFAASGSWSGRKTFTRRDGTEGICEVDYVAASLPGTATPFIIGINRPVKPSTAASGPRRSPRGDDPDLLSALREELDALIDLTSLELSLACSRAARQSLRLHEARLQALHHAWRLVASSAPDPPQLDLADYLQLLRTQALDAHFMTPATLTAQLQCPDRQVPFTLAVPLGLLFTEILHGLLFEASSRPGVTSLALAIVPVEGALELRIQDDGSDFSDRMRRIEEPHVSMDVLRRLASLLNATISPVPTVPGATVVTIPVPSSL